MRDAAGEEMKLCHSCAFSRWRPIDGCPEDVPRKGKKKKKRKKKRNFAQGGP